MTSSYDDLIASNPYRNFTYRKSWWQNTLQKLGFRTQADAYKENMAIQAAEYDAAIAQKKFDTEYESAPEQVNRMRQAGLNPDLDPSSVSAGDAATMGEDPSTPMQSTGDEGQLMQFANTVMSAVTTAFGLGKDFFSLQNMGIINRAGELQNSENTARFADWIASTFFLSPEALNRPTFDAISGEEISPYVAHAADLYNQYSRGIPRKYRRQFARNLTTGVTSFKNQIAAYEKGSKFLDDKLNYNIVRGRRPFKYGLSDDSIMSVVSHLSELADKVQDSKAQFDANKAEFDAQLYSVDGGLDPKTIASSQNQIASESGQSAQIQRMIDSTMKDIVSDLRTNADHGDFFSKMLLLTFSLQRMTGAPGSLLKGIGNIVF